MRLLYRESKGVLLSPAGETLLAHVQQLMRQVELLRGDMQQYNNGIKGHIRIFANTTAVTEFMPQVLGAFLSAHPHVNVSLEERLNHDIVRGVQDGTADIGVAAGPVQGQGLEIVNFSTDRLVLATATGHPLAQAGSISFTETLGYPHIGLHEGSTLQHFLNRVILESGDKLQLRIQVCGFDAMCRMVEADVGVGILPQSAAARHSRSMQLALVELTDPWAVRERSVLVQTLEGLPVYARELVELIRSEQVRERGAAALAS
jgi:DNA-binding transcriptional LysR family regulator